MGHHSAFYISNVSDSPTKFIQMKISDSKRLGFWKMFSGKIILGGKQIQHTKQMVTKKHNLFL